MIGHRTRLCVPRIGLVPRIVALAYVAMLLTCVGCGGKGRDAGDARIAGDSLRQAILPALDGAVLRDSMRVDVDGDGRAELVVASRADDGDDDPLLADRFDRIDIYTQGRDGFRRLFVDAVDYGAALDSADVTGDGVSDLLIRLDAGGNNPIATQGLHIYGRDTRGAVALLFYSASGAPALRDLDGDGRQEVLVSDQYWGMMAHSEVIGYTRAVYAFAGDSYEHANTRFTSWFDTMLKSRRRTYEQARRGADSEEGRTRLYLQAAEYLVWHLARGGVTHLRSVWNAERGFLRQHLHDEQYDDLETFVDEATAEDQVRERQGIS